MKFLPILFLIIGLFIVGYVKIIHARSLINGVDVPYTKREDVLRYGGYSVLGLAIIIAVLTGF